MGLSSFVVKWMGMKNGGKRSIRVRLHEIIFESDTPAGKFFDVGLIAAIILSVLSVMLESVPWIRAAYGDELHAIEWTFTVLFTVEYVLRLVSVHSPAKYATSLLGIIDLVAFLPTYLTLFFPGAQIFFVIRTLRLLRLFRVFKMVEYVVEGNRLMVAMRASRPKIIVFLFSVVIIVMVVSAAIHVIERDTPGFESIPSSMYWAIVTVTTVGFGDVTPLTTVGKIIASMLMVVGYGILAVPTGIVTAEMVRGGKHTLSNQVCPACSKEGHESNAVFCKFCGTRLNEE